MAKAGLAEMATLQPLPEMLPEQVAGDPLGVLAQNLMVDVLEQLDLDRVAGPIDRLDAVDRRRFGSDRALVAFLGSVSEAEHARHLAAIRAYLGGDGFGPFLVTSFAEAIAAAAEGVRA